METLWDTHVDLDTDYMAEMLLKDVLEVDFGQVDAPLAKVQI